MKRELKLTDRERGEQNRATGAGKKNNYPCNRGNPEGESFGNLNYGMVKST